jgi:sporulation protein YlmC with PRC-barrel domain
MSSMKPRELVGAHDVEGTAIYNPAGNNLGRIDDIVIDQKTGVVAYAVMSSGGILGIGSRHHPLPWTMLKYNPDLGGYVINLDRAQLEVAPALGEWL